MYIYNDKAGGILRGPYESGLHAQFIFCLPDNNDLKSQIPILVVVMSHLRWKTRHGRDYALSGMSERGLVQYR